MKTILKYTLAGLMILAPVFLHAQEKNRLEAFYDALESSCLEFTCEYTFTPPKTADAVGIDKVAGEARIEIQGDAYVFDGNGLVVKSDGKSVCIIDEGAKEIVYEAMPETLSEADFLQNPAYLVRGLKDNFKVIKATREKDSYGDHVSDVFVLAPLVKCGILKCRLSFLVYQDSLPYVYLDMTDGSKLKVLMSEENFMQKKPLSYFAPPAPESFDSSWIVTDLR